MATQAQITAAALLGVMSLTALCLGAAPLIFNPWKRTHQVFAVFSTVLAAYLVCCVLSLIGINSPLPMMLGFVLLLFMPVLVCHFALCLPLQRIEGSRILLVACYGVTALAALWPPNTSVLQFFPGIWALVYAIGNLTRKTRTCSGVHYRQVSHALTALLLTVALSLILTWHASTLATQIPGSFAAGAAILFCGWCAVALIRYHLPGVKWVFVRLFVALTLAILVTLCILASIGIGEWMIIDDNPLLRYAPTALAALLTALVIQPAKDTLENFVHRFILQDHFDGPALIGRVTRASITKRGLIELMSHAGEDIRQSLHAKMIRIWLRDPNDSNMLDLAYSSETEEKITRDGGQQFLLDYLDTHTPPLILEHILHRRPNPENARIVKHLAALDAFLLVPLRNRSGLVGIITLGDKRDKDIYTRLEAHSVTTAVTSMAQAIHTVRLFDELEDLNQRLEAVLSSMRGGVVALNAENEVVTINKEARRLLPAVFAGATDEALPIPIQKILQRTPRDESPIRGIEVRLEIEGGKEAPVALSISQMKDADGVRSTLIHLYDMSEIRQLEWTVRRADRLTAIGTLAAGMAHEIKNPLQSIKTFTQLLLERFDDPDFRMTYAEVVPPEVARIDGIVSRLLHFARPQPANISDVNVCECIQHVLALVSNEIKKADIEAICDCPVPPLLARGDEQQLHQVFLNLVLNSIEAMQDTTKRLLRFKVEAAHAALSKDISDALSPEPCIRITVSDTGNGIESEDLEQLFTPFYSTSEEGSGLGLAVVHGIISEHGGSISVSSVLEKGTSVTIFLPQAEKATLPQEYTP